MTLRALELLALTLLGGSLALFGFDAPWAVLAGCLVGALVWVLWDNARASRVLNWLRQANTLPAPRSNGLWNEVVERSRKNLKTLNRKARKSDVRLQEFLWALQTSPNGVVLIDRNACIEWCNLTAAQHLGLNPQRDLGQQIRNLVRAPDFLAYLNEGDFSKPVEIDGADATPSHPHRVAMHIHVYGKGRRMLLTRDVTALQLAEVMRRDFVANVSHEIRTPLTVVSGFIETLQNIDFNEDERQRYYALMNRQAQRMQGLVNDLLTLSRLEGSPAPDASEWMKPAELLDQVLQEGRALSDVLVAGEHTLQALPCPDFEIAGARSELLSAMSNLVSNAVRYTPAGGIIDMGWRLTTDGGAEFFVSDTGPGIEAEHLPRLTERFYRVDRSRSRETGGTGLGLAIVKHVAQRHGGLMRVESQVGQGSRFAIVLPAGRVLQA
jgi:two-component system, OmpR family, phosphate regulon sensor histidine kinase PhoR